jgi:cysteine desulfurase
MDRARPYLDYAATTPLDPRVQAAMMRCYDARGLVANPSSPHRAGTLAGEVIDAAAGAIRDYLGDPHWQVVWTSGATEADNLAILGSAEALAQRRRGRDRILITATEHTAVTMAARAAKRHGFAIERLPVDAMGRLTAQALADALDERVALVSIAPVNNETGVFQAMPTLAPMVRQAGALLHLDAAQSGGRVDPAAAAYAEADMVSLSGHKFYGPKGVGALCLRPSVRVAPQLHGGGQQQGLRSGTLPVPLIAGLGEAFRLADDTAERDRQWSLRNDLLAGLAALGGVVLNTPQEASPHILSVSFAGVHGAALRAHLDGVDVGFGSACSSHEGASPVLRAMRRPEPLAHATLRFSLGRFTREIDITHAIDAVGATVDRLRRVSPVWRALAAGQDIGELYATTTPLEVA